MKVEVIKLEWGHVEDVAQRMRKADWDELAATGVPHMVGLRHTFITSNEAYAGLVDGVAVTIFGVARKGVLSSEGKPWMIGTVELERYAFAFARRNKPVVAAWRKRYTLLHNFVHEHNKLSIRWLKWLGFTLGKPVEYGVNGERFIPFHMIGERQCVGQQHL